MQIELRVLTHLFEPLFVWMVVQLLRNKLEQTRSKLTTAIPYLRHVDCRSSHD